MPTPSDTSGQSSPGVPTDSEGAESPSPVEPDTSTSEERLTGTPPPWYLRKLTVAVAVALGVILSGVGVFGFVSASAERSVRDEALEATSQNLEEQGRIESATAFGTHSAQEAEGERAQILDQLQAVEARHRRSGDGNRHQRSVDPRTPERCLGPLRSSGEAVSLEQEISDKLETAVERGNRRQVESMVRIAEDASESVDDLHGATDSFEEHLGFDMTVSGFGLWEDSDASSGETTEGGLRDFDPTGGRTRRWGIAVCVVGRCGRGNRLRGGE